MNESAKSAGRLLLIRLETPRSWVSMSNDDELSANPVIFEDARGYLNEDLARF